MWKLVIEDDENKRTVVHLTRDAYTIGRKEGHPIRLTERNVSREHARLEKKANGSSGAHTFVLEDLKSYNGVFVNGVRIAEPHEMIHSDLIQVGDYRIIIQDDAAEAAESAPTSETTATMEDLKVTAGVSRQRITGQMLLQRPNRLVMLVGPTPGAEFPLDRDHVTIGRAEEATVSVNHNSVSRMHCEIQLLAEGRYEIKDTGSSNGVRVNGADIRRGIIEAGDFIELGDVRFKFVGAGQIFVANSTDSQKLAAIGDRQADEIMAMQRRRSGGSMLPFILLGLALGGGAVGIVYYLTRPPREAVDPMRVVTPTVTDVAVTPTSSAAPTAQLTESGMTLARAVRFLEQNPQEAHRIANTLPADDELRASPDFARIENAWARLAIQNASSEPDHAARKAMLDDVVRSKAVNDDLKAQAQSLLAPVDAGRPKAAVPGTQATSGGTAPKVLATGAEPTATAKKPVPLTPEQMHAKGELLTQYIMASAWGSALPLARELARAGDPLAPGQINSICKEKCKGDADCKAACLAGK